MNILLLLGIAYAIYKLTIIGANNITFIGKNNKIKIIMLTFLVDILLIVIDIIIINIAITYKKLSLSLILCILIINIAAAIFSLSKIFKTITEHKTLKSTLMNCAIKNINIGYKLVGDSLEGNKNTFILYGKDGKDIYRAIYNGVVTFDITYYSSSKRIVNIKLLPYGPSQQLLNMYNNYNDKDNNKKLLSKK